MNGVCVVFVYAGRLGLLRCVYCTGLDFYGCVKLVNYVRTEVASGSDTAAPAPAPSSGDGLKDAAKAAAKAVEAAAISSKGGAFSDEK